MANEMNEIESKYLSYLCNTGRPYNIIGKYTRGISLFLEQVDEVSRTSYLHFKRNNADLISREPYIADAICDMLSYMKIGYGKKMRTVKSLEKISVITAKNQKIINEFLDDLQNENDFSPNTIRNYSDAVKKYFSYCNEFSSENVKRFIKTLEVQKMKPATLCLRITVLERLSKYLKKPIAIKRPKVQRKLDIDNVPTASDYDKLLQFLYNKKNKDYYFYVKVLATTGMRVSELMKITWEDIINGEVTLSGKGNKYRRVFFTKTIQHEVKQYAQTYNKSGHFLIGKQGELTARSFSMSLKIYGAKCGISRDKMHPHAFRHFFAKMFLKKNKDVIQLADLLGHGSIDTTRIYLQKSYDEQKREFNKSVTW